MKRPQPDLSEVLKNEFVASAGSCRKLKRLWGTTIVDDVEVFNTRNHYFVAKKNILEEEENKKLFKFLRVYNDVKDFDGSGLKSAWFTLNKSNGPETRAASEGFYTSNLNKVWWDINDGDMPEGLTLTTSIVIGTRFDGQPGIPHVDFTKPKDLIAQSIKDNYELLWATNQITQEGLGVINKGTVHNVDFDTYTPDEDDLSPDDPWLSILSRYALRDDGVECTIKDVEVGVGIKSYRGKQQSTVYNSAVVTLEIPYTLFTNDSPLVQRVFLDMEDKVFHKSLQDFRRNLRKGQGSAEFSRNEHVTHAAARQVNYYETEEDIDESTVSREYLLWEEYAASSVYGDYWINSGGVWYLKADVVTNPKAYGTNYVDLNKYILGLLDTGYKKEKVPKWKKVVAAIVFIIAVVISFVSAGTLSGPMSYVMAAAYAVMVGALVISLVSAVFGALGMTDWYSAFAAVSRAVAPLVAVASIILVVGAAVQSGLIEAAKEYAINELDELMFDKILGEFGELGKLVADIFAGGSSNISLKSVSDIANAYTSIQLKKLENLSDRTKDLAAEYEKLADETNMESDVARSWMNIYAKPATADWSVYASTYDLPYESGGGTMAIGNIQKTTKQATRKADYTEPMFDGFLLV